MSSLRSPYTTHDLDQVTRLPFNGHTGDGVLGPAMPVTSSNRYHLVKEVDVGWPSTREEVELAYLRSRPTKSGLHDGNG